MDEDSGPVGSPNDEVMELCCNLDDMTGEALGYAVRVLLDAGALDVFTTAIDMKKDRPGTMLTCICREKKANMFASLMLKHTSSFGVRRSLCRRYMMDREIEEIQTPLGKVRLKTGTGFGVTKSKLEYDDVAKLADEHNLTLSEMECRLWVFINSNKGKKHDPDTKK